MTVSVLICLYNYYIIIFIQIYKLKCVKNHLLLTMNYRMNINNKFKNCSMILLLNFIVSLY